MNERVREYLIAAARRGEFVTYSQVNRDCHLNLDFQFQPDRNEVGRILGTIGEYEYNEGRPILSAVVIHQDDSRHGVGFYNLCEELGLGDSDRLDRDDYGMNEMGRCFEFWRNN